MKGFKIIINVSDEQGFLTDELMQDTVRNLFNKLAVPAHRDWVTLALDQWGNEGDTVRVLNLTFRRRGASDGPREGQEDQEVRTD